MGPPKMYYSLIFIVIAALHDVKGNCDNDFDPIQCAFKLLCDENNIERQSYGVNSFIYSSDNSDYDYITSSCQQFTISLDNYNYNYGRQFYPIHFKLQQNVYQDINYAPKRRSDPSIPNFNGNNEVLRLITDMDVSDNNYKVIPDIKKLENLAVLKLSRNLLTVAVLSNVFKLSSLVEIDYSHNAITNIQYDNNAENLYSSLVKINLSYNQFTIIPERIFVPFGQLQTLDVSHNYIDTISQITFEGMSQLLHLNLSFNKISDINSSLFRFNDLKLLDLSNNKIKAVKESDFSNLINLETLDLGNNLLQIVEKDTFHNKAVLRTLSLNNNELYSIDKDAFSDTNNLNSVDISGNNLKALTKGMLKGKMINEFSIMFNSLEGTLEKGSLDGLLYVTELDLSRQSLQSLGDYAFYGLNNLKTLLLNNNQIKMLSSKCFRTIQKLQKVELSYNIIESIDFEKDDLFNLLSLSLRNNHLTAIKHENLEGLSSLQFLDLSNNNILQVESNSFKSLKELVNFEISNNPLSGTLKESTFDGLNSLPSLDISCTLLSNVQNGSFTGMVQLKQLNVSHSKINLLEYNTFVHTGAIEIIDLSYNKIEEFNVNSTELTLLQMLYLNNNIIKMLDPATFQSVPRLILLDLAYNLIQNINSKIFNRQKDLHKLDVSYNTGLKISLDFLNETKKVKNINLSGIKTGIIFGNLKDVAFSQLLLSNSSITDLKTLQMNELLQVSTLSLNNNDISKIEVGDLFNMSNLRELDISYNKISYVQPGAFRDNSLLITLNMSHNLLTDVSYGIFHGLIHMQTLDISYNEITDLHNERFYQVSSLSVLIADHNKIKFIKADEFMGINLTQLSIGENPIPCDALVNLKRIVNFEITASRLDQISNENYYGVICNKKLHSYDIVPTADSHNNDDNVKVLLNIREILVEHFKNQNRTLPINTDERTLLNVTDQIKKSNADIHQYLVNMSDSTSQMSANNNKTNILLSKILNVLTLKSVTRAPPIQVSKDNATYENLLSVINKMKQDLEDTMQLEKVGMLNEIDTRISAVNAHVNDVLTKESPKHEKLTATVEPKSFFTEICVGIILVILVGFVLLKIYKSGFFVRRSFSISTRELPGDMDSTL